MSNLDPNKQMTVDYIDSIEKELRDISDQIWSNPELQYKEYFASNLHKEYLKSKGFRIEEVDGMDTAFIAFFGSGEPVMGILGEYDSLAGLSQKVSTVKEPVTEGAPGHGCGHNLLGTGAIGAAVAVKKMIEDGKVGGTVKYFGTPAEEDLSGKIYMIDKGCFDGIDCAFSWHPFDINTPIRIPTLANYSIKFRFRGISAHAAQAPQNGRSALDAVELMNVGCNYLREHIFDSCRLHYSITDGGGAPNIVPAFAEVWYYVRGVKMEHVQSVFERVVDVAKGAALMTSTQMEYEIISGVYDYIPNNALTDVLSENMKAIGTQKYNDKDIQFAKALTKEISKSDRSMVANVLSGNLNIIDKYLHTGVTDDTVVQNNCIPLSLDIGDISYLVPTAQCSCSVWPIGVSAHTWQSCSSAGSDMGFKAMLLASKSIACTVVDVMNDKELVKKAKEELVETKGDFIYKPIL
ncbi:M20 family metallopeptidase [Metaclostridioides mangenotii]|uniref:Aminobenzoyl-glutamate utilization protein B n=1 Tax=Metaclostridioides mangenotii TaxID=1540 RepID=A0ABS4ECE6_9FIRM|nr:M20 family metallopeptidase [Clostridioides mangenotii]MBP1855615.1 aminobenzoyl-glutamate utilization protein B [Clostridioides mangenotii]